MANNERDVTARPPLFFGLRIALWYASLFVAGSIAIVLLTYYLTATSLAQRDQQIIRGKRDTIELALICLFCEGHVLIEDYPGLAKTLMVSSIAQILDIAFKRIQFTPDLMPSDITGTTILDENEQGKREFRFVKGPIFANIVLADEINRTPPKTQAALLQAMQERLVTIDRDTHKLSPNFTVFATQNPIEYEGTYPLAEAQKDRFMLKISMPPTNRDEELTLAKRMLGKDSPEAVLASGAVKPVITEEALAQLRRLDVEVRRPVAPGGCRFGVLCHPVPPSSLAR